MIALWAPGPPQSSPNPAGGRFLLAALAMRGRTMASPDGSALWRMHGMMAPQAIDFTSRRSWPRNRPPAPSIGPWLDSVPLHRRRSAGYEVVHVPWVGG